MKTSHEPSQARELFRRQFRLESPRTLGEDCEHHFANFENTLSLVVRERADDRNFLASTFKSARLRRGSSPGGKLIYVRALFLSCRTHGFPPNAPNIRGMKSLWKNL